MIALKMVASSLIAAMNDFSIRMVLSTPLQWLQRHHNAVHRPSMTTVSLQKLPHGWTSILLW